MTREEFCEKYKGVNVKFSSYYKYTFTYKGELEDGSVIYMRRGGGAGEIYRDSISVDDVEQVDEYTFYAGSVVKDGVEIDSYYDF